MKKIISLLLCVFLLSYNCFAEISFNGVSLNNVDVIGDSTWYRKTITITGSSDSSLSDYPIMLRVHHGSGTDSSSDVYLGGKTKVDFSDVRFTSADGTTALKYWKEFVEPADLAIFWIKIPTLPASPSTLNIYIYHNNTLREDAGDGDDVFTSFVDKDDAESFNSNKRWISVSRPYKLDPYVNISQGTVSQTYGMGGSVKLADGTYLTNYMKYDGTTYSNDTKVEGQRSGDKGKTWEGRQIVYDDPSYNSEFAGLIQKDNGNVVALVKLIDRNFTPNTLVGIKYAESTDGGVTWPDEASWSTAYGPTDYIHGIPDDWVKIGDNWYAMSENVFGPSEDAYSQLLKYDGTTFTTVSQTPVTPDQTTEAAVASLGGQDLLVIQRHRNAGGLYLDASSKTIKITSNDLGTSWSSQDDIADDVGIIQDPNLTWVQGVPGNGTLMLSGRQGPNIGTSPDLTQQDNVAWFSYDNALTWKNKTVLFANTQTSAETVGGYVSAIVDGEMIDMLCWTDNISSIKNWASKRLYIDQLEDFLELHAYAQSNDLLADIPFSNGGLTKYSIEIGSKAYSTTNADITSFVFNDGIGGSDKVFQGYIPRFNGTDIGFLNGSTNVSNALYNSFQFNTRYVLKAEVDSSVVGAELLSISTLTSDRSSVLASTTNKPYSKNSPTGITHLEIGTDTSSGRSFSHIYFVFLRKKTTNEPTITAYGVAEITAIYPA